MKKSITVADLSIEKIDAFCEKSEGIACYYVADPAEHEVQASTLLESGIHVGQSHDDESEKIDIYEFDNEYYALYSWRWCELPLP